MEKPSKTFVENRLAMLQSLQFSINKMDANNYNKTHLDLLNNIYTMIKINKNKQFIALDRNSADFAISYAKDITAPFETKRRVITTLGRYVRRQFQITTETLPDVALDEFSNRANAFLKLEKDRDAFKILSGTDVRDYYRDNTGMGSCMEGANYFRVEIYALNPDKVSLLTFKNEGRALIWTCDDGLKYMDRIYGNNKVNTLLELWAKENGYTYLYRSSGTNPLLKVALKYRTYLPSIDTFHNVVWDHANKQMICYNRSQANPQTILVGLGNLTVPGVQPVKCVKCNNCVPDEDKYKTKNGSPICDTCRKQIKICKGCGLEDADISSFELCPECEKKLTKKCANKACGKRALKTNLIKMKRQEATKVCFVCCEGCMQKVNPDWVIEKDLSQKESEYED